MSGDAPSILVILGSPRDYGSSTKLAHVAMEGVKDAGGRAEIVRLYEHKIKPCLGCVSDDIKLCRFPCVIDDDDFNALGEKMMNSDGYIIATPVYWYAPSGTLKNFIDRLTSMENMSVHTGRSLLEGKVAGFVAAGLDSGVMMAIAYLMSVFNSMGVVVAPWSMAYSHMEDVTKDENALRDAYNVGYLVVETVKALKAYGKRVGYNWKVDVGRLISAAEGAFREEERTKRLRELEKLASKTSGSASG